MKNTSKKRLTVTTDTIRVLGAAELAAVAGGGDTSGCPNPDTRGCTTTQSRLTLCES